MAPEADHDIKDDDEKNPRPLDEDDIALLKTYVIFPSFPLSFFLSFFLITNPNNNYVDLTFLISARFINSCCYCIAMLCFHVRDWIFIIFYFFLTTTKSNYAGKLGWGDGFTSLEHFKFWI